MWALELEQHLGMIPNHKDRQTCDGDMQYEVEERRVHELRGANVWKVSTIGLFNKDARRLISLKYACESLCCKVIHAFGRSRLTLRIRDSKGAAGLSKLAASSFGAARCGPTDSDCMW